LCAAYDREFLDKNSFGALFAEGTEIRRMIVAFVKSMVMQGSGVKNARRPHRHSEQVWEIYERITGEARPEFFRAKADS